MAKTHALEKADRRIDRASGWVRVLRQMSALVPTGDTATERAQVARHERVTEDDQSFREQHTPREPAPENVVPTKKVRPREPALEALPLRAQARRRGADVNADRVQHCCRMPAGAAESEGEVEILAVEGHVFVEPADGLPRDATVRAGRSRWSCEHRPPCSGLGDWKAAEPRKARERRVRCQTDGIDRPLAALHEQRRSRPDLSVRLQRTDEVLEKVGPALDVIVEQDDDLAVPRSDASVARGGEAQVASGLDEAHLGERLADIVSCAVGRCVVDEDRLMRGRLLSEEEKTSLCEIPAIADRDDDINGGVHAVGAASQTPRLGRVSNYGSESASATLLPW